MSPEIRCIAGANALALDLGGRSVGWVRTTLREALNLGYWSESLVNGVRVPNSRVLAAGDCLEFLCRSGFKGSGGEPAEQRKARGLLKNYPELVGIGEEVRSLGLDGPMSIEETLIRVAAWAEANFGPLSEPERRTLQVIAETVIRIDDRLAAGPGHAHSAVHLSIKEAAGAVNLSESHIRRIVARGELPASNVGSAARPTWRIARADLDAWIGEKKGGSPKIPPRSDLKDMIRRHLPGL